LCRGSLTTTITSTNTHIDLYTGSAAEWDAFVRETPGGTFFHLTGWRNVIEAAFGYRPCYLAARRAGVLAGVLPLFEIGSKPSNRCLLSLPFAVEGGVCAADEDARRALEDAVRAECAERGARYVELRDGGGDGDGDFRVREGLYYRFRRAIFDTDEANMAAIRRKQRRMIRVGEQSGLVSQVGSEDLDVFHDLYARSVQQLGTPVFSRRYFSLFLREFPDDCVLLTVRHGGTPVAAVMSFFFNDTVLPYYAGSRREFFRYAVNDFMYWQLMCHARARGMRVFDFGRSKKGTGAFDFKCHWGFEPEPLRYRLYMRNGDPLPDRSMSDDRLQFLKKAWSRLPLPLTKLLGPFFIRRYGAYYT
jgi:FemAB-related protein (PEP-CTERM system-associated)